MSVFSEIRHSKIFLTLTLTLFRLPAEGTILALCFAA